jgi:hypothetical protein
MSSASTPRLALAVAVLAALVAPGRPAEARGAAERYVFLLTRVELSKTAIPPALEAQVRAELARAFEAHPDIDGALPEGTPDPETQPDKFKAYLKKRRLRAFRVNVQLTDYERAVEARDARDRVLTVRLSLHLFGEAMPERVMAFTGEGSTTIKIEIGKTVRDKDQTYADQQAIELAVTDAIATSIKRLREHPPNQDKAARKKSK